jgi:beta-phosphoglucomutase-like phosphatase (HAD superfamily)
MDGVIVDTEPVHHFAYKQHFEQLKIDVSPEIYASFTGNSTKNIYQKIKSIYSLSESVDQLVQQKRFFLTMRLSAKTICNYWTVFYS